MRFPTFKTNFSKLGVSWAVAIAIGVGTFVLVKQSIDNDRREAMKVRERMRNANTGDYEVKRRFTG